MPSPEPFPSVVDSTTLGTAKSCLQKVYRTYIQHWKPSAESVHLVAGKAFASGLEAARRAFYVEKWDAEDSIAEGLRALTLEYGTYDAPEDSPKSWLRMAGALEYYFMQYPLGADGATPHLFGETRHGIEFSFAEPLDVLHPITGDPILYAGRADMVADAFGGLFLYDEKTTSRLGPTWLAQWDHRSQFTGYSWGVRSRGKRPTGTVVRGVSILKNDYGTAQAITYRSDWEIDRCLLETNETVDRMIHAWRKGYWNYNLDHACTEYSGCPLTRVCKSPDPERWLSMSFTRRVWDPLTRSESPSVLEPRREMPTTHYFLGRQLLATGECASPWAQSIAYTCSGCGEVWARILVDGQRSWQFRCSPCPRHTPVGVQDWGRIPGSLGDSLPSSFLEASNFEFLPLPVLTREFLILYDYYRSQHGLT